MASPVYTASDFTAALQRCMPRGRAWPRDQDAVQTKALSGFAPSFARNSARALDLLVDAFPATSYELLPEWESALGLPGICGQGLGSTIEDRQRAVVAALTDDGSPTVAYVVRVAEALGYSITVTTFRQHSVASGVDAAMTDEFWANTWQVNGASYTAHPFTVASSVATPLTQWDNFYLGCVLERIRPAHTTLIFNAN